VSSEKAISVSRREIYN